MSKYLELINQSKNFNYLKFITEFKPVTDDDLRFKYAIDWAIFTIEEQAKALSRINESYADE